ncbi:FeoB-associated Cys-rich membrane protein [Sphingobacterium corticis]|uniref:FeoB-associated Cys-rich membrane protein n=1 Tax=Sphingobacterium corticis TaxID=1812823 RepID=A0ABW5NLF1_9SPHI
MTLQYIIIGILFCIAIAVLARRFFPKKSSEPGCGGNCKCDSGLQKK